MDNIDLQKLVKTLDASSKNDLEAAAQRCIARNGSQVLIEDVLAELLGRPDSLLRKALEEGGVDASVFQATLTPRQGQAEARQPVFSTALISWLQDSLLVATLELGQSCIDDAALLLALIREPLSHAGTVYYEALSAMNAERVRDFALARRQVSAIDGSRGSQTLLASFTHDFTQRARDGKLDPVLCRSAAIRQMIDILSRRRKNNPIAVGEAGVGKTAVVEGLAQRIVDGDVPDNLKNVRLLCLDLGLLQAGASIKGEFERRLQGVIDEVKASVAPIILFIDEAHTLIGAGGQAGSSDAANLLKPALARGELRTIAATTWAEYARYFEKDPALARRFQPVRLSEPTVAEAIAVLRGLAPVYERGHGVYLRDDAVVASAELSARYLAGRQLPDKAVDVLDTACARVRISLASPPERVEQLTAALLQKRNKAGALRRDLEKQLTIDTTDLDAVETGLHTIEAELTAVKSEWHRQRALAEELLVLRAAKSNEDDYESRDRLQAIHTEFNSIAAEDHLVSYEVCPRLVAEVISHWTGVPVSQLAQEHSERVEHFAERLGNRIKGQPQAIHALDRAMRAAAAGLNRVDAPAGVFLLVGPSGVGKTETALALADLLYGGERFLTTINMSEFQEKHSVSRLIGAPPGYVGYGEGGMLTEAVRQKPYSVVLLDEVEKADPDVLNVFYQIFDKGVANDGEGREIDFRNALILMTSNLASDQIAELCKHQRPDAASLSRAITPALSSHFKPALLGRMTVVPFYPVSGGVLIELVESKLTRFAQRLARRNIGFTYDRKIVESFAANCEQQTSGARLIDQIIEATLQPLVVDRMLQAMAGGTPVRNVHATVSEQGAIACEFA